MRETELELECAKAKDSEIEAITDLSPRPK